MQGLARSDPTAIEYLIKLGFPCVLLTSDEYSYRGWYQEIERGLKALKWWTIVTKGVEGLVEEADAREIELCRYNVRVKKIHVPGYPSDLTSSQISKISNDTGDEALKAKWALLDKPESETEGIARYRAALEVVDESVRTLLLISLDPSQRRLFNFNGTRSAKAIFEEIKQRRCRTWEQVSHSLLGHDYRQGEASSAHLVGVMKAWEEMKIVENPVDIPACVVASCLMSRAPRAGLWEHVGLSLREAIRPGMDLRAFEQRLYRVILDSKFHDSLERKLQSRLDAMTMKPTPRILDHSQSWCSRCRIHGHSKKMVKLPLTLRSLCFVRRIKSCHASLHFLFLEVDCAIFGLV